VESVRAARAEDRERLAVLAGELVASVTAQRGGPRLTGSALDGAPGTSLGTLLGPLLDRPDALVLVGALDGVVVGFAVSSYEVDARGTRWGRLGACFVEPEARAVGVGRLLLERSLTWMAEEGCAGVDGTALPGDRGAKSFFESAGFKARLLIMHREFD
jgi:GNAT superfamily N-acetyltransferase